MGRGLLTLADNEDSQAGEEQLQEKRVMRKMMKEEKKKRGEKGWI